MGMALPESCEHQKYLRFDSAYWRIPHEDLHDEEEFIKSSPDSVIDATVRVYEMLGAEVFLYFSLDQYEITARVNPRTTARPGDTIKVAFDASKIHLFDKETEQVICN